MEFLFIKFAKTTLFSSLNFFESLISLTNLYFKISVDKRIEHETTGPQNAPLPTSSIPII